ncbi:hypothetical protein BD779DRAFT_1431539 [Infundibulicybe gibba]|nr:hypothetical protein BD779DRAFT_1431539 [Infundibulicybe gibba]
MSHNSNSSGSGPVADNHDQHNAEASSSSNSVPSDTPQTSATSGSQNTQPAAGTSNTDATERSSPRPDTRVIRPCPRRGAGHPQAQASSQHLPLSTIVAHQVRSFLNAWVPHPLTRHEIAEIRLDCLKRRREIDNIQAARARIHPVTNLNLDTRLFLARSQYEIAYCRIFRFNDLPTEIINNIYRYVVWSAPHPHAGIISRLWITWTCKRWRTIATQDSTLWNAIWFRDRHPFNRSFAWLDRAGTAPLDIRINDKEGHKFTGSEMEELLDRLFTKVSHIRMLIVIIEDWEPVLTVLDKLRAVATSGVPLTIERFELHRTGSPYVQPGRGYKPSSFRQPMPLFGGAHAPTLKYFSVNGVYIDWHKSTLTNLTTIDIRRIPLERSPGILRFRDLLSSSPSLYKLCLDGAGPQWQPDDAHGLTPVELPNLKVLVVADFSLHYGFYLFSHISAPKVVDLTLMNFVGEDYSPLFALITPKFPAVKLLTVYSIEPSTTPRGVFVMVKWLESMPLLRYLRIANIKKSFLELFLYNAQQMSLHLSATQLYHAGIDGDPDTHPLCPSLVTIECQAVSPDLLAAWGRVRRDIKAPLQKIYVSREMASAMKPPQHYALAAVAQLAYLDYGARTPEEDEILREG